MGGDMVFEGPFRMATLSLSTAKEHIEMRLARIRETNSRNRG
jgi:hypothetical protein